MFLVPKLGTQSKTWFRKYFKNQKSLGAEMKTVILLKLSKKYMRI